MTAPDSHAPDSSVLLDVEKLRVAFGDRTVLRLFLRDLQEPARVSHVPPP